jgi:hypothetical protein
MKHLQRLPGQERIVTSNYALARQLVLQHRLLTSSEASRLLLEFRLSS